MSAEDCPVIRWLMTEGRHIADAKSFLESFAACLRVAGVELRNAGVTDYVVLPVPFSDGTNKALSLATTRVDGFSDDEIALFAAMMPAVAVNLEIQALRRMARTLLDTYVGRQSGGRVLAGQIRRGMGETINAVIWLSDLRGFTSLSESSPRDELIEILNCATRSKRAAAKSSNSLATPCWRSFRLRWRRPPPVTALSQRRTPRRPPSQLRTFVEPLLERPKSIAGSRCTSAT